MPVVRPARGERRLPHRAAVELDADPRARGGQVLPHPPHVDGLAARLLLQPENINIQVHPGYDHVLTITPTNPHLFDHLQRVLRRTITRWW